MLSKCNYICSDGPGIFSSISLVYLFHVLQGIPIIYYGTEQGFSGPADPNNREILWSSGFVTSNPLYSIITTLISYRKSLQVWNYPQVQRYPYFVVVFLFLF